MFMFTKAVTESVSTGASATTSGVNVSMGSVDWTRLLTANAGVLALAAFAGVMLGGIAMSFFWKNFGPWKMLDEARKECADCRAAREEDARARERDAMANTRAHLLMAGEIAEYKARYEVLLDAVKASGLGMKLSAVDKQ